MPFLTEIRPGLNSNTNTLLLTLLRELHRLLHIRRYMPTQRIMQIPNKVIPVLFVKRHKRTSHQNELYFINIMADFLQLLDAITGLDVGVVTGTNCAH